MSLLWVGSVPGVGTSHAAGAAKKKKKKRKEISVGEDVAKREPR